MSQSRLSPGRARALLWAASLLWLPLPYLALPVEGQVPVVRFLFLGAVTGAYSAGVDGGGVAWMMTSLLLGNALVWALVLGAAAWLVIRLLPEAARSVGAWGFAVALAALGLVFPIYRTPFDDVSAWTRWLGLFQ